MANFDNMVETPEPIGEFRERLHHIQEQNESFSSANRRLASLVSRLLGHLNSDKIVSRDDSKPVSSAGLIYEFRECSNSTDERIKEMMGLIEHLERL